MAIRHQTVRDLGQRIKLDRIAYCSATWVPPMYDTCTEYLTFYKKYAKDLWDHLTPLQYLILLTAVGVIGFMMMLKSPKRIG